MELPPEPSDPTLDEAVLADLEGTEPYRRYAAWLNERGDPRGELIQEQLDGGSRKVFDAHRFRFLSHLEPKRPGEGGLPGEWHAGFLKRAAVTVHDRKDSANFAAFLGLRSSRFLRSLAVTVVKGAPDFSSGPSLPIRTLSVAPHTDDLGRLSFRGAEFLKPATVASIGRAGYDHLTTLELSLGGSKNLEHVAALEPILDEGCPSLKHLNVAIHHEAVSVAFVKRLAKAPLLARLESLQVHVGRGSVDTIVGRAEAFAHLKRFIIRCQHADVRSRIGKALPGVPGILDEHFSSVVSDATGPAPEKSPVPHAVPLALCAACRTFDVVAISYEQDELSSWANNQRVGTRWSVQCRRCSKVTAWSGMDD